MLKEPANKKYKKRHTLIDDRMKRRIVALIENYLSNSTKIKADTGLTCSTKPLDGSFRKNSRDDDTIMDFKYQREEEDDDDNQELIQADDGWIFQQDNASIH